MDQNSMDPYERQLYAVFTTFADGYGTLDSSSMTELCAALQMEAGNTDELVALAKRPGERVAFPRFRDALLKVLGGSGEAPHPSTTPTVEFQSDEELSERELSPKLVYGSKKYGRRSRPRETSTVQPSNSAIGEKRPHSVRRATSSPGDSRRPPFTMELDRCVSVPHDKNVSDTDKFTLDLDHNRTVDCDEAMALCRSMQMGNVNGGLLRQIFEEGDCVDVGGRITVGEFFHRLNKKLINSITLESCDIAAQSSQSVGGAVKYSISNMVERELVVDMWERAGIAHCRQMLHDLGFSGNKVNLTELSSALDEEIKSLLSDVDKSSETNVPSLLLQASLSLHRHELRCIRETMEQVFAENSKMKTDLNEANQRAQMLAQEVDDNHAKMESSLKNKVKQLETKHAETMRTADEERAREKEATNAELSHLRERLGALETEEGKLKSRCSSLERSNEDLERRLTTSRELTLELEQVRTHLMREVRALTAERDELREPGRDIIGEVEKLTVLVSDFRLENKSLRDKNDELCVEIEDLQGKLTREKRRLSLGRSKPQCSVDISSEQAVSLLEEWGRGDTGWDARRDGPNAIKRRGDSPSKGLSLFEDESPRIGKLRRCHTDKDWKEQLRSESAPEWELDSCSDSGSFPLDPAVHFVSHTESHTDEVHKFKMSPTNDIPKLNKSILTMIKEVLESEHGQEMSNCESCNTLKDILSMINKQITDNVEVTTAEAYSDNVQTVDKPATEVAATQTDEIRCADNTNAQSIDFESERKKHEEEKAKLTNMCRDLESSLEQLKSEYDKCEEYWANKLDEEREIFSEEQRISDEKFTDLLSKISEYEEQFSPRQKCSSNLSTIDEKYSLEIQFTDLEEEFQFYQRQKTAEIEEKVKEINQLKEQLKHLKQLKVNIMSEDSIANLNASPNKVYDSKVNIITNVELEKTVPQANSPIDYLWNQSTIQSPVVKTEGLKRDSTRDYQNPAFAKTSSQIESLEDSARSSSDNEKESASLNPIKKPTAPKRCNSADLLNNPSVSVDGRGYNPWCGNTWSEVTQGAGNGGAATGMIQCSELEGQLRRNAHQSQDGSSGWSGDGADGARRSAEVACLMLEQRCRQLQLTLRQHQSYFDTVQQNARSENSILRQKLFSAESAIGKLQQRLTTADMLVKELYVENCQLSARKPQLL